MDVILLEKVRNLGGIGDKVSVRPGFGRNFLIPNGKAVRASADNLAKFEAARSELEAKATQALIHAQARAAQFAGLVVRIGAKSGDEGKLFGSVGTRDISDAVTKAGAEISKHEVLLPNGPLRHIGEFDIDLQLHSDVKTTVKVAVVAE